MAERDPLIFENGRLNLSPDIVRAVVQTNQLGALGRFAYVLAGSDGMAAVEEMASKLKAERRRHLRLIRGGLAEA